MYMRSDAANDGSEKHRIIRAGIAFGDDEDEDKGLLFVCYQRSIENQFEFIKKLASNANPNSPSPGLPFDSGMTTPATIGSDLVLADDASGREATWYSGTIPLARASSLRQGASTFLCHP
jgi:hypothetical protein